MIAFKRTASVDEWTDLHPALRDILLWLHDRWPDEFMVITRIFTPEVEGESGVHRTTPHRAADIRTATLVETQAKALTAQVNANWAYGNPARPTAQVALYHAVSGGALHLHLQVHEGTRSKPPGTDV